MTTSLKLYNLFTSFEQIEDILKKQNNRDQKFIEDEDQSRSEIKPLPNLKQDMPLDLPPSRKKEIHLERPIRTTQMQQIPTLLKPQPKIIDPNDFVQQLNHYTQNINSQLLRRHIRLINHLLEMFEEVQTTPQQHLTVAQKDALHLAQKQCFKNLQQDIQQYLDYPPESRPRYDPVLKTIPDLWLTKQLQHHIEQLIEKIAFLYEHNLQALLDHQNFLEQKFNETETEFQIILPHSNTPKR